MSSQQSSSSHLNAAENMVSPAATSSQQVARMTPLPKEFDAGAPSRANLGARIRKKSKGPSAFLDGDFARFSKLPVELQLMVWNFSMEPRTVEMRFLNHRFSSQFDILSTTPAILQVNRQVRQEFLKNYKVLFEHEMCRAPAYFNSEIDVLHIRSAVRRSPMSSRDPSINIWQINWTIDALPNKSEVRHLSISPGFPPLNWQNFLPILRFQNLETLTISFVRRRHECKHDSKLWATAHGRSHITPVEAHEHEAAQPSQDWVKDLLDRLKAGEWGNMNWKIPEFIYKGLCLDMIHSSQMFCGSQRLEKAKIRRDAQEEHEWRFRYNSIEISQMIKEREKRRKREYREAKKQAAKDMSWLPGYIKKFHATNWKAHRIVLAGPRKSVSGKGSCQ